MRRPRRISGALLIVGFGIGLFCQALQAYVIAGVPLEWVGYLIPVGIVVGSVLLRRSLTVVPGLGALGILVVYLMITTIVNDVGGSYWRWASDLLSTPYPIYQLLRVLRLLGFAAAIYVVARAVYLEDSSDVRNVVVGVGLVVSMAALYLYFAPIFDLPTPSRTRVGTGGGRQTVEFLSYPIQRALGTFREPSHLAVWLVVPFCLSLVSGGLLYGAATVLFATVVLLTGSMAGVFALLIATVVALILGAKEGRTRFIVRRGLATISVSVGLFSVFSITHAESVGTVMDLVAYRLEPILEGGIRASNRGYVLRYLLKDGVSLFGQGLGNANIAFTHSSFPSGGAGMVASLVSFYAYIVKSGGIVGLAGVIAVFLLPLHWWRRYDRDNREANMEVAIGAVAGHIAWMAIYVVVTEEATMMHGVAIGILSGLAVWEPTDTQSGRGVGVDVE